jgi:DNA repair exonuclease SbcCD nuclease subunit
MNTHSVASRHKDKRELLTAILTLCMLDEVLSPQELDALIIDAKKVASKRIAILKPSRKGSIDFDALGHVVYRWQRSPKYLDETGSPLKIHAKGRAPSVEALFREIGRTDYFELGLRHLRQLGRVQRTKAGLFHPCNEVTIVQQLRPELLELLVQTINRVVATVLHNTSLKDKTALRLIERVTAVPDLPEREIAEFKLFAREQGGALINTMNDWLERRRGDAGARRLGANHVTAGLHVFAFVEEHLG